MRLFAYARPNLCALVLPLLLGCAANPPPAAQPAAVAAPTASMTTQTAPPTTPSTTPLPPGVPDTPAGHQLAWVLASMNSVPAEADMVPHFSPAFLAHVPVDRLLAAAAQVVQGAPYTLEKVTSSPVSDRALVAVVRSNQGKAFNVHLAVEAEGGRIEGLLVRPKVDVKVAASWDEVARTIRDVAPQVNFLAAELDGKKCVALSSVDPQKALALGSAFKLYVLDALAMQIASGKHHWDEMIAIDDAHKSLPSGDMRDEPAGKTFSVRHFAEQMISVSDNTATDHLIAFLGRTAVENAVKASGHATPARLTPFLSTREMFSLKLLASPDEQKAYLSADTAHRRALLDTYGKRDPAEMMARIPSFTAPVLIDSLEWHASPEDLCKVMADLHEQAKTEALAPIAEILSKNPGIPDEKSQYKYIGFKGGGEPGVLNSTFVLQRARDDKWLFLTVGFNDPNAAIDDSKAIAAIATAREFLGR